MKASLFKTTNRSLFPLITLCLTAFTLSAQTDYYRQELQNFSNLSRLPLYPAGEMEQLSSYDRTGANDDGFSGKYSAIRTDPEGLVIADLKGPGIVNRIWTPTPTADTLKFYFDGEKRPRIAVPFIDLFTGKQAPFVAPLCGNQLGGFYCYLPIPYEKSLRIVFAGKNLRFHQTQYRTMAAGEKIKSFSMSMFAEYKDDIAQIAKVWNKKQSPLVEYGAKLKTKKVSVALRSGSEIIVFSGANGGRIVGIEFAAGSDLLKAYRKVLLTARWDGDAKNGVEVPLHDFFGFAFGKPAAQSIVLGSDSRNLYSYLPMPFDKSAEIKLKYEKSTSEDPEEVMISGTIYFTDEKRNPKTEGRFYTMSRREYNIPSGSPHVIADVKGRGHYVGTILITQGLQDGSTWYFEGDDQATIDGKLKIHGTGSEDYFNGGYYAVMDKWDKGMSLPIHGSLEYDLMTSRTGGYRFYLSDKLNFKESFKLTIEHQPDAKNNVQTDYTSLAMFYAENPQYVNTDIRMDAKLTKIAYRDKLTAQGMVFSLYWLAAAQYEDPAIIFTLKKSNSWTAGIDIEAVPIAQVILDKLDNGRYKLYVEYAKTDLPNPFSVWQRSTQISDWISSADLPAEGGKTVYAGEIEITDKMKTITLRKKIADDTAVKIISLQFEKIVD
jgi:hypothetical protein